jgi:hypothetical protein
VLHVPHTRNLRNFEWEHAQVDLHW